MARVSRADPGDRYREEFKEGSRRAKEARKNVAQQVSDMVISGELTGSRDHAAARLREVLQAEGAGDTHVLRAAVMEASAALASWAVDIDLRHPSSEPYANGSRG
jgi:hypothetical protein